MVTDLQNATEGLSLKEAKAAYHPLDPLSAPEIKAATAAIRPALLSNAPSGSRLWFKSIQLIEPPKADLAPWLDTWHAAGGSAASLPRLPRKAECIVGTKASDGVKWYEVTVLLDNGTATVENTVRAPDYLHVSPDMAEMIAAEEALLANPEFQAAIAKLQLPPNAKLVADGWIYGADSTKRNRRLTPFMVYLNFTDNPDSCHYAAPLPLVPVVDSDTFELVDLQWTAIDGEGDRTVLDLDKPFPWEQYVSNEYDADLLLAQGVKFRDDVKPYRVVQPEGASFSIAGRVLRWQKWSVHIGFNYREGPVLSDIRYDGRKVFYRLSVSEMSVPYADPRAPLSRKQAMDLGDIGAGLCANELALGCDCLGEIAYLDFDHLSVTGENTTLKSVVCIHEQDNGIGWKHTNYRTGKAGIVRARKLVIQTIITVANYEYIFAWELDNSGAIHLETRATGILSTHAIMPGETSPFGNVVSPGVLATNHQHIFCMRIDPSIDGHNNTIVQEDSVPMPFDAANPPANNPTGVGYTIEKTPIAKAGFADAAPHKNRCFKIINPSVINPVSQRPVGYKLVPNPSQLIIAHPDSIAYARAEFGEHHVYVTKYKDGELYAAGKYTNQSYGNAGGMRSFIARGEDTEDTDVVLWHSFGITHNPAVEQFPVMPCETFSIKLSPHDYHSVNPMLDVPPSTQAFNQSKLFNGGSSHNVQESCCA